MMENTIDLERASKLREEGLKDIQPYLGLINNLSIRAYVQRCLEVAPVYFWMIPASSSGKYHPAWAVTESGLLRHTVLTAYLANELARTFSLDDNEREIAVAAALLHDTLKYGIDYDKRYHDMHSYLPRNYYDKDKKVPCNLTDEQFEGIFGAVESHMGSLLTGEWNPVRRVYPQTPVEQVVHLADYVASRKKIEFVDFK
jgi:hypothetical protein